MTDKAFKPPTEAAMATTLRPNRTEKRAQKIIGGGCAIGLCGRPTVGCILDMAQPSEAVAFDRGSRGLSSPAIEDSTAAEQ